MNVCGCITCAHVCMQHACVVCMYVYAHAYVCMCMYMCVYVRMYIYIYIYLMQKHLQCKKVQSSKVESYLEV